MMKQHAKEIIEVLKSNQYDQVLKSVYIDENVIDMQRSRYIKAIEEYVSIFGDTEVEIYSAPGRSEIGGNHTDHQNGKVLAASVNIDAIAVVCATTDNMVHLKSDGYDRIDVDLSSLDIDPSENGTTAALIRGVAAGMKEIGCQIGGFNAYVTSQVISGSGLSSSAAFEILMGTVFSGLYNQGKADAITLAKIGQKAENIYFGKPSGLMDQMACSVGGLIYIDFEDTKQPLVEKVDVDFASFDHSLCIIDTKGSHADLTDDYAAIPAEMKKVAAFYGKEVLRQINEEDFYRDLPAIRELVGDRALLRAIHWFNENGRVEEECRALRTGDFSAFKKTLQESGDSSFKFLQNVFATHKANEQGLSLALVMTEKFLKDEGAWRVHGGGFAGTIQAFVPNHKVADYKKNIEQVFGEGSCYVLKVRPDGGIKVI